MPRRILAQLALLLVGIFCACLVALAVTTNTVGSRADVDILDRLTVERPIDEHVLWVVGAINGAETSESEFRARFSSTVFQDTSESDLLAVLKQLDEADDYRFEGVLDRTDDRLITRLNTQTSGTLAVVVAMDDANKIEGLWFSPYEPQRWPGTTVQIAAVGLASLILLAAARHFVMVNQMVLAALFAGSAGAFATQLSIGLEIWGLTTISMFLPWFGVGLAALGVVEVIGIRELTTRNLVVAFLGLVVASMFLTSWVTQVETADLGLSDNLLAGSTNPEVANRLLDLRAVASAMLAAFFLGMVLNQYKRRPVGMRPVARPLVGSTLVACLAIWVLAILWFLGVGRATLMPPIALSAVAILLAGGVLGSVLAEHLKLTEVAQLAVDIGDGAPTTSIEESLRRALADPDLELLLWSEERNGFTDSEGIPNELSSTDRAMTRLEVDGQLLGAVVHHPDHRAEQIRAACSAVRLAIENLRLHAEVRKQLQDVRASRGRLVVAADNARRRLERDLHDGAQQGLLASLLDIQRARRVINQPAQAEAALDEAVDHLEHVLLEVREIAQGLRPGALDRGLFPAIRNIADRCGIPVEVEGSRKRFDPNLEQAAYYVVCEALTNITRHAEAGEAIVSIEISNMAVVSIVDDGNGKAEVRPGGGLQGIIDRVEALGGRVAVRATPMRGTSIEVRFPMLSEPNAINSESVL